jgi:hypothetical protein
VASLVDAIPQHEPPPISTVPLGGSGGATCAAIARSTGAAITGSVSRTPATPSIRSD